jgi:hypothetical protein
MLAILVIKTLILALGGGITFIAYKAHRRTGEPSLRALAAGFGIITFGALLAGIAHQLLGVELQIGVLINSLLVAIGLAIIMYSLYIQK